jgi:hypothetical protein
MSRRRTKPVVEVSGRMSLRIKSDNLRIAIERELGLPSAPVAPLQLELTAPASAIPERSVLSVRSASTPAREPTCTECRRRGYHLVACPNHERNRRTA